MDELRRLDLLGLVPVVELEPGRFATGQRDSPAGPAADNPVAWDRYWSACLADSGITGLEPLSPGSWHVPTRRLTDAATLGRIVRGLADAGEGLEALLEPDGVAALSGGFALTAGADVLLEPTCCGDLADLAEWREAAAYRQPAWKMVWIGHPWLSVRWDGDRLALTEPHEDLDPVARYAVAPGNLSRAIGAAEAELASFVQRLEAAVNPLVGVDRSAGLARQLGGMADGRAGC